jgi:2-keto-3-deoxy-L-rhamnonate aldolase RhmA/quercetin dioxygenase-like cupin family protein
MKTDAIRSFRGKLALDQPVFGLWLTLEAPSITEMAVALGLDWVVIDAEHGHLDWKEIVEHLRATVRSDTVALVRLAELNAGLVKRALDIGADGIVIPWVETAEQVRQARAFALYPPEGVRGIGAERATAWGQCLAEHTAEANDHVLVVPIIETVRTAAQVPQMCQVQGTELFFFGPADYSSTAGFRGQWEGPGVAEQILKCKDTIRAAGKNCGVMSTGPEDLMRRREQGFRMIGLGSDTGLLLRSLKGMLAGAGQQWEMTTAFLPRQGRTALPSRPDDSGEPSYAANRVLPRPPDSFRPDRPEVMTAVSAGPKTEIEPGVTFECLVGAHGKARGLTTGQVTFAPAAQLAYHTHPFSESITLLQGKAAVEVEGRSYNLEQLDNVVIPRGLAHQARNLSDHEPAVFHIAMASNAPTRTLVPGPFPQQPMPREATGRLGAERVNRFETAPRFEAGPGTEFIDFFNKELLPGIEMSGGYGRFRPQGRLPAHVHDFDESIAIIEGTATCVVEGRRHALTGGATALVPRGRVHYFINESASLMAMLWVYAGPVPERIVVDERCATAEGCPWR